MVRSFQVIQCCNLCGIRYYVKQHIGKLRSLISQDLSMLHEHLQPPSLIDQYQRLKQRLVTNQLVLILRTDHQCRQE